jgi:deoxyadenosine/deoxycytidine kinase
MVPFAFFLLAVVVVIYAVSELVKLSKQEKNYAVVVIDGIIGAGKSTLVERFFGDRHFVHGKPINIVRVFEPVVGWNITGLLETFYSDPQRYSYLFQTVAFTDRVMANVRAFEEYLNSEDRDEYFTIFVLERSCFTDPIFMTTLYQDGNATDLEYTSYLGWAKFWKRVMPYTPDLFVYIRPSVEKCMSRIAERNRGGEVTEVSCDYQRRLLERHDDMYKYDNIPIFEGNTSIYSMVPAITLRTDEDFKTDDTVLYHIVDGIIRTLGGQKK